jgi:hypothetical protein
MRSEASYINAGGVQVGNKHAPCVQAKNVRLPAAAVQSRYDLHERPFRPARVEIGYAKRDARRLWFAGHLWLSNWARGTVLFQFESNRSMASG